MDLTDLSNTRAGAQLDTSFGCLTRSPPEQHVADFLTDLLHREDIEEGFNVFLVSRPDLIKANSKEEFIKMIQSLQGEEAAHAASNIEAAVKFYVSKTASTFDARKLRQLFSILHHAVNKDVVSAFLVCKVLLNSEELVYTNQGYWVESFKLVRKIIVRADYKEVREFMIICFKKATELPRDINSGVSAQLESLKEVLSYIFDRKEALLPGYFIVNEILKSYPENKTWPHWRSVTSSNRSLC